MRPPGAEAGKQIVDLAERQALAGKAGRAQDALEARQRPGLGRGDGGAADQRLQEMKRVRSAHGQLNHYTHRRGPAKRLWTETAALTPHPASSGSNS
jgi:hypothetical protein